VYAVDRVPVRFRVIRKVLDQQQLFCCTAPPPAPAPSSASSTPPHLLPCDALQVAYGEKVKIVGNRRELGQWNTEEALELEWNQGDVWSVVVPMPVGKPIEFKVGGVKGAVTTCKPSCCTHPQGRPLVCRACKAPPLLIRRGWAGSTPAPLYPT
jgi:hypothetical protein